MTGEDQSVRLLKTPVGRYEVWEHGVRKTFNLTNGAGQTVSVTELWDTELPDRYRAILKEKAK